MPAEFLDTNVLIYLLEEDEMRAATASRLVDAGAVISVQVLNEVAAAALRKRPDSWMKLSRFLLTIVRLLRVEPLTLETHLLGLELIRQYRLSVYDATIVAAALLAGCDTLWSEDMQDGLVINRQLTIRNPFAVATN
jgi:predicted nucleic acid-binding protein